MLFSCTVSCLRLFKKHVGISLSNNVVSPVIIRSQMMHWAVIEISFNLSTHVTASPIPQTSNQQPPTSSSEIPTKGAMAQPVVFVPNADDYLLSSEWTIVWTLRLLKPWWDILIKFILVSQPRRSRTNMHCGFRWISGVVRGLLKTIRIQRRMTE